MVWVEWTVVDAAAPAVLAVCVCVRVWTWVVVRVVSSPAAFADPARPHHQPTQELAHARGRVDEETPLHLASAEVRIWLVGVLGWSVDLA